MPDIKSDLKNFDDPVIKVLEKWGALDNPSSPRRVLVAGLYNDLRYESITKNKVVADKVMQSYGRDNFIIGYLKETGQFAQSDAQKYIEREAFSLVKNLTRTDMVRMRSYMLSHWPIDKYEFRKFLREESYICSDYRADMIYRTEMHKASEAGHMQSAKRAGRSFKTWNCIVDKRTRPAHLAINGQTVGITDSFSNGLEFPQEPHCRCWLSYKKESL